MPKFGTKNALFGYFRAKSLKNYCQVSYQHLKLVKLQNFWKKTKLPLIRTKNALFGYFLDRILKAILVFESSTLKLFKLQNFTKKLKYLNLRPKILHLEIFGLES